jgi:hypothetical protein
MGKELPVSTMEAADAAIELAKGGLSPATLQAGALRDTLNFASAAQLGLAESANIAVKQMGTFVEVGASAEEQASFMKMSMDLLTKAANASTVNVDELADGMLAAGGTAKAVGVDYKDFVVAMGALSPAFSSSAEAGTSFKNFLLRLQPTTKTATDEMTKLGLLSLDSAKMLQYLSTVGIKPAGEDLGTLVGQISTYLKESQGLKNADIEKFFNTELSTNAFYDATGQLKSMSEVAEILSTATAGLTDQQKSMALSVIFGNDAMNAAVQLSALGAKGVDSFTAAMDKANGVSEMFSETQKGANAASTNFQGTMEALQISMGTNFLPLQEMMYTRMNDVATVALNMANAFRGDTAALNSLSPTMAGVVNYLKEIDDAYSILKAGLGGADISYALDTLPSSLAAIVEALMSVNTWWNETIVATGLLAETSDWLVMQGMRLYDWLLSLLPIFTPLVDAFYGLVDAIVESFMNLMPFITDIFGNFMSNSGETGDFIKSTLDFIVRVVVVAIDLIGEYLVLLTDGFKKTWDDIGKPTLQFVNFIIDTLMFGMRILYEVVIVALEFIKAMYTGNWEDMETATLTFMGNVYNIFAEMWGKVATWFNQVLQDIIGYFVMFIENIPLMLLELAYDLGVWVRETKESLITGFTEAWTGVKWVFENAWPMMKEALTTFPDKMRTWISDTWTEVKKAFSDLWTWDKVGESMSEGFIEGIRKRWKNVIDAIGGFAQQILNAFNAGLESKSPSRAFMRAGKSATDGFVLGITQQRRAVLSAVDNLAGSIVSSANNAARETNTSNVYNANRTNNYTYNLGVTTAANANDVIGSFAILEALV